MKEENFNIPTDSYFLPECPSPEEISDDNNFHSSEAKPENIFEDPGKDNSEAQLSSKILNFPFTLDSYQLIYIKSKEDPEFGGEECKIILGNLEKLRYDEPILKLTFFSKDRRTPLNLNDFPNEMNSLKINLGIEFISIFQNKLFIQCENENSTNEAYVSLQKSSTLFDLLYDEERSINSLEEPNKGINSLYNSGKKNNDNSSYEEQLSDKKEKKTGMFNKFDAPILNNKDEDLFFNSNKRNIWNINQNNEEKNSKIVMDSTKNQSIPNQNQNNSSFKEESPTKKKSPITFPSQLFPSFIFPLNNLQKNQSPINPSLLLQMTKINPFILQTALAMQNLIKMQQLNLKTTDNKEKKSPLNIFNGKNDILKSNKNIESGNNISSNNNKESSTNSNSSSSSKESSPSSNYQQPKNNINNININFNIPNINFGLFNGFNFNNATNSISNPNNNINNNIFQNDITNNLKINEKNKNNVSTNNEEDNNSNLERIVLNKKYKEYIPKKNKEKELEKEKEKDVEFHTKSTRDYKYKYVSRYIVQIENEKNFPVTKMIIGNNGKLLRKILVDNCINYGDHTTKIRLRGKGSGYKEGPKNEESKDPMELCISSLNMISYMRCSQAIENLLLQVYYQYYLYQCNNNMTSDKNNNNDLNNNKEIKDKNGCPIIMKKILKYQYVVNRYNTLVKEEKRKKKEEELKQANKNNINNKDINHI